MVQNHHAAGAAYVVLSEIGPPDTDGRELALVPRRQHLQLEVFAISAIQRVADQEKSQRAGIELHLPKPLTKDPILSVFAAAAD